MLAPPPSLCPFCGYNLVADERVAIDGWTLDPETMQASFSGEPFPVTNGEFHVLFTIAKAGGRPMKRDVIADRFSDAENRDNIINVLLARIRRKCEAANIPVPIASIRGVGLAWVEAA